MFIVVKFARIYVPNYKKVRWNAGVYVETCYDVILILKIG